MGLGVGSHEQAYRTFDWYWAPGEPDEGGTDGSKLGRRQPHFLKGVVVQNIHWTFIINQNSLYIKVDNSKQDYDGVIVRDLDML